MVTDDENGDEQYLRYLVDWLTNDDDDDEQAIIAAVQYSSLSPFLQFQTVDIYGQHNETMMMMMVVDQVKTHSIPFSKENTSHDWYTSGKIWYYIVSLDIHDGSSIPECFSSFLWIVVVWWW